jgi:poly(3-hydroxybutyrate) depolymerase
MQNFARRGNVMLYDAYELQRSFLTGASALAEISVEWLNNSSNPIRYLGMGPIVSSALDVFAHAAAPRGKPDFGFVETEVEGRSVPVFEEIVLRKPFGQLKRFKRLGMQGGERVLVVAPMSGHFATLLRGTVERLLPRYDVYITDWRDAKLVPLTDGRFDFDDYIDYLVEFMEAIGAGAHVIAVCQPSVPALAAVALMSADKHHALPATLTMMGGPIDTREAPTAVNLLATQRPHSWFEQNVIATVPFFYPGASRRVYPGFLQLAGFMTMNLGNHLISHYEMFKHLVDGDGEEAQATKSFYEEYRAVADMTAEFYLQTIDVVFQRHLLPRGGLTHRGVPVDLGAIRDVALLAVEGERDDISGLGQTRAALTGSVNLSDDKKGYYMAPSVGHYGIFNGRRWREEIAPIVEAFIDRHKIH